MMHTVNRFACEPFPENSVKVQAKGDGEFKVATVANTKTTLVRLKVLFDARFPIGSSIQYVPADTYIWVRANLYASDYGREIFSANGGKFILIPYDRVEVLENGYI